MQLEYLSPEALCLQPTDLPTHKSTSWPQPKQHRWPFNSGLVRLLLTLPLFALKLPCQHHLLLAQAGCAGPLGAVF